MGDPPRSPQPNFYSILGLPKSASLSDIGKAYKSLVMKWHPDRNSSNKAEAEAKFRSINEAYRVLSSKKREETLSVDVPKKPKNPFRDDDGFVISSPSMVSWEGTSRRSPAPTSLTMADFLSRSYSETMTPTSTPSSPSNVGGGGLKGTCRRSSSTPIIFSQSSNKKKPQPIEMKLECTLEELCHNCVKTINITRDVISATGLIIQEEETLRIRVKPGWRRGTKITFEGKGDERPGSFPADIIFAIEEKIHELFKRDGDDLELGVEVPLVQALTGCTINVPLLGGENMTLSLEGDIIYPGYEKIIVGQGMPRSDGRTRGNLRLKFLVEFPTELSAEQRSSVVSILNDCT